MVERKAFLGNPKHQYYVTQRGEHDCIAHNQKKCRFLWVSKFVSFQGWTLITGKMAKKLLFLQIQIIYRVSQCGEHDYSSNNKKDWRLLWVSKFVLLHRWTLTMENGGKKSFSCKSKALISCTPMRRTWL